MDGAGPRICYTQEFHLHPGSRHSGHHAQSGESAPRVGLGYREETTKRQYLTVRETMRKRRGSTSSVLSTLMFVHCNSSALADKTCISTVQQRILRTNISVPLNRDHFIFQTLLMPLSVSMQRTATSDTGPGGQSTIDFSTCQVAKRCRSAIHVATASRGLPAQLQ